MHKGWQGVGATRPVSAAVNAAAHAANAESHTVSAAVPPPPAPNPASSSHPKQVKLQSQGAAANAAQFRGPIDAAAHTLRNEGIRGMYRGMGAPLATVALFNAVLFASRGQMEALLAHSDGGWGPVMTLLGCVHG